MIRCTLLIALAAVLMDAPLFAQNEPPAPAAAPAGNVNSRYVVEGVEYPKKLSASLRTDIDKLVGTNYNEDTAREIAARMRGELHGAKVTHRLEKGDQPDRVKLYFETTGNRRFEQAADITKLAYQSKQGVTAGIEAGTDIRQLHFGFGVQTDADTLLERYAGINGDISRTFADRVQIRMDLAGYHEIWNGSTVIAAWESADPADGIYRERRSFSPTISVALMRGLIYTAGIDIEHMQFQYPAARTEAANSVMNTLRLHRSWGSSTSPRQTVDAGYSLRAATRVLDSDFVYARHYADARYTLSVGDNHLTLRAAGGRMTGRAPLFERFAPGNSSTLRGWNKFDLAPLGKNEEALASVEYRYDNFFVFYDMGLVWDPGEPRVVRHGTGAGFAGSGWYLAVAFPIRTTGSIAPVLVVGTNF